jgi:hypothetical protein
MGLGLNEEELARLYRSPQHAILEDSKESWLRPTIAQCDSRLRRIAMHRNYCAASPRRAVYVDLPSAILA